MNLNEKKLSQQRRDRLEMSAAQEVAIFDIEFSTEKIMGDQNFKFTFEFFIKQEYLAPNLKFLDKKFPTKR